MTRQIWMILAGAAAAWAQGQPGWFASPATQAVTRHVTLEGQTGPVTGRPLSASEVRHSVQVLSDGTHVEGSDTSRFYRDNEGRMRSESGERVEIYDPVAGFMYELDLRNKTYLKQAANANTVMIAVAGTGTRVSRTSGTPSRDAWTQVNLGVPGGRGYAHQSNTVKEDLPPQTINGIPARGSRSTATVPAGTIGNDRDFKIVNERWYSDDLQVLLKTTNSDPRFGTNSYELTNIAQGPPDAALFQIPAGYTARPEGHY